MWGVAVVEISITQSQQASYCSRLHFTSKSASETLENKVQQENKIPIPLTYF